VDELEKKMVFRDAGIKLFHREGPITVKDLYLTIVVLAQGTRRSRLFKERRGRKDVAEKGNLMDSSICLSVCLCPFVFRKGLPFLTVRHTERSTDDREIDKHTVELLW